MPAPYCGYICPDIHLPFSIAAINWMSTSALSPEFTLLFSQTAEYALRAVVWLATQPAPRTTRQIAAVTKVPAGYLSKVLQALGRADLVRSQRGLHGGFTLGRTPDQITVLQAINAVDAIPRIRACPLGLDAHCEQLCPLHQRLDDALATVEQAFDHATIADLISHPSRIKPLCDIVADTPKTKATRKHRPRRQRV